MPFSRGLCRSRNQSPGFLHFRGNPISHSWWKVKFVLNSNSASAPLEVRGHWSSFFRRHWLLSSREPLLRPTSGICEGHIVQRRCNELRIQMLSRRSHFALSPAPSPSFLLAWAFRPQAEWMVTLFTGSSELIYVFETVTTTSSPIIGR